MAALLRTLAGSGKNAQGHGRARSLSFDATKLRRSSGGVNLGVTELPNPSGPMCGRHRRNGLGERQKPAKTAP